VKCVEARYFVVGSARNATCLTRIISQSHDQTFVQNIPAIDYL